jgi:hypothetical protein
MKSMKRLGSPLVGVLILSRALVAQAPSEALQPVATTKQIMVNIQFRPAVFSPAR